MIVDPSLVAGKEYGKKDRVKRHRYRLNNQRKLLISIVLLIVATSVLSVLSGPARMNATPENMNTYIVHAPITEVRALTRGSDLIENYGAFVMVKMSESDAKKLISMHIPVEKADYMEYVEVANYPFKVGEKQNIPSYLKVDSSNYYILKFKGPIKKNWRMNVEKMGFEFKGYIPYNTFLVKGDRYSINEVKNLPYVEYVGIYQPAYRIEPFLLKATGMHEVKIVLFREKSPVVVAREITEMGGTVIQWEKGLYNNYVVAKIPHSLIYMISKIDGILWIEKNYKFSIYNDIAHGILQGASASASVHPLWDHGLWGWNQIVGESDTGIDYDHTMFRDTHGGTFHTPKKDHPQDYSLDNLPPPDLTHRKIVHYWTYVDGADTGSSQHGTHVAGSIAGNATPYSSSDAQYNGEAPSAKLSFVDIGDSSDNLNTPSDLNYLWAWMYHDGARIASQSWGSSSYNYTSEAMNVDQFMWNHPDFLIFFANGNSGSNAQTVGSPATAKDCVSVGALGSYSQYGGSSETLNDIASFSSRGPTGDGRLKPTIVSPGVAIDSAKGDGDPTTNNSGTTQMDGTSMATPNAAGVTALIREYFMNGYYPNGQNGTGYSFVPSGALLKAMLINSADQATGSGAASHYYNGMTYPNNDQGFGRPSVKNVTYFPGSSRKLLVFDHGLDEQRGLVTGETWERKIVVSSSSEDLKVTLVWTDYPSVPVTTQKALINDLDLVVTAPNGTYYHGNVFAGSTIGSVYSKANPTSYDRSNPEEEVWIHNPGAGTWTIQVIGYSVAVAQPFAVVVTGDLDTTQSIELDKNVYSDSDTVKITVIDTSASGSVTAHISSTTDSTGLDVILSETTSGSHVFVGTVQTSSTSSSGKLQVSDGDTITATYGNAEATAAIDATVPSISNLHVENVRDTTADVVWDVSEYTNYTLQYGTSSSLTYKIVNHDFVTGIHRANLLELQPNTTYYVKITVWDRVNHTVSGWINFTTCPRLDVLVVDDDASTSNWEQYDIDSLVNNSWEYSVWHYALQGRPPLSYLQQYKVVVWDTADGYPPIDDDDVTQVLEPYLDGHGRLFIIGQDIGWAAFDTKNSPWATTTVQNFIKYYLGAGWNADDSGGRQVQGTSGDPVGNGISDNLVDRLGGMYPDELKTNGGTSFIVYPDASNKIAGVRFDNTTTGYRTVYLGYAFQDMATASQRDQLMNQSVYWLLNSNMHPYGKVTYPNGGETVSGSVTITWDASDDGSVAYTLIFYSDDGGNTWHFLGNTTGTSYTWDTTSLSNGDSYLIKVIIYDNTGLKICDTSDGAFTVQNQPVPEFGDGFVALLFVLLVITAVVMKKRKF